MKKIVKSREDFVNENYYESSPTAVPGAGVGAGLFAAPTRITEKNRPQQGANGIKSDPDYAPPAPNTHAVYLGQIQLGDIVEDIDKSCKYYGTVGKTFAIDGSGEMAMVDYIIANQNENFAIGEVARTPASHLTLLKKHQMNGAMNESVVNEAKDLKVGDIGVDYNDTTVKVLKIGKFKSLIKEWEKKMNMKASDVGLNTVDPNENFYLVEITEDGEGGDKGDYAMYPVKYDMGEYWGLEPVK